MIFTNPEVARAWASFTKNPGNAISMSWDLVSTAYGALFEGAFGSPIAISETLLTSTPLILAGLSVALAFRAGLFNIGAEGQMIAGMLASSWVGFTLDLPLVIHLPLAIIAGFVGGGLWGGIAGFLKAKTGAHEVITTIMLNFIALHLLDLLSEDSDLPATRSHVIPSPRKSPSPLDCRASVTTGSTGASFWLWSWPSSSGT